jgi:DNA-binding transcriptional MerR regulator
MAEAGPSHLSIGEVLGLLLEEFPDVTISKIRFLESQGLIEPERTPSGYRKFFDDDVVLLRLILREQREKFLPLRVIKDRIDSGEIEPPPDAPSAADDDREQPTKAAIAKHPAARRPSSASVPSSGARTTTPKGPPPAEPTASSATAAGATAASGSTPNGATTEPPTESTPSDPPSAPRKRRRAAEPSAATLLPGVLVNREELCAMASVTPEQLAQLEDYGVVSPRAGVGDLYGDEAVEIAAAAGGFLRAGVDARHLRAWRTSVERESGLYEQLILPLLRQRNPQARGQAGTRLEELDGLGTKLRAALMRAALRQYLEG